MTRFKQPRTRTLAPAAALLLIVLLPALVFAIARERDSRDRDWPEVERAPVAEARERPNIILVYTDDQDAASFNARHMPQTTRLLGEQGTVFSDFIVTTPLCCPSRASLLTGNYPHNSGVFVNKDGYQHVRDKANTLGVWMQRAGYETAWVGKFLQGYNNIDDPSRPAPGFDRWAVSLRAKYYGWKLFADGHKVKGGVRPGDYYTEELTRRAVDLVGERGQRPRPLFMVLNHLAPHRGDGARGRCAGTVAPAPADHGRFEREPLPRPSSFNEADRSDKTAFAAPRGLSRTEVAKAHDRHRCRLESLAAVDRGVADLYRALERRGELENTVLVFTSDNGLLLGEHALTGKGIPYEEGLRVPLAIRVPERLLDRPRVAEVGELTTNVDLTASLLELADARPCYRPGHCRTLDGRSLVSLIEGRSGKWPGGRAIPIEGGEDGGPCGYRGLRLEREVLLQAVRPGGNGACAPIRAPEYYDLDADPFQLDNLVVTEPRRSRARVAALERRLAELEGCSGIEGRDRPPAGGRYCE
jgi:N-acetylglucosamine-6-sulfatase